MSFVWDLDSEDWTDRGGIETTPIVNDVTGQVVGLMERHACVEGPSIGSVPFEAMGANHQTWSVLQEEPLTLHPSIMCRTCGNHGWIRNGVWEAC